MSRAPHSTRTDESRVSSWRPADNLPMPDPDPDWKYRYVRKSILGEDDPQNMWRAKREGWEPVTPTEMPEFAAECDCTGKDTIELGGLVLCRLPTEIYLSMVEHYQEKSDAQVAGVDENLMRQEDPRMPLYRSRSTTMSGGRR